MHQFTSLDELKTAGLRIEHSDSLIREQNRYNFNYSQSSQQGQYRQHANSNYRNPSSVETQSQIPNRFGPAPAPAQSHSFNSQRPKGAPQIPNGPPPLRNYGYQQSTSVGSGVSGQNPYRQTQFSTPKTPTNGDTRNFQFNRVYPASTNVKNNALNTDVLDNNPPDAGDVSLSYSIRDQPDTSASAFALERISCPDFANSYIFVFVQMPAVVLCPYIELLKAYSRDSAGLPVIALFEAPGGAV